jgi:hypothetical protein
VPLDINCKTHRKQDEKPHPCIMVRVFEWGSSEWAYLDPFGCRAGDFVLVEKPLRDSDELVIPGHTRHALVGLVVRHGKLDPDEIRKATKFIVQRIDWDSHVARTALHPPPAATDE